MFKTIKFILSWIIISSTLSLKTKINQIDVVFPANVTGKNFTIDNTSFIAEIIPIQEKEIKNKTSFDELNNPKIDKTIPSSTKNPEPIEIPMTIEELFSNGGNKTENIPLYEIPTVDISDIIPTKGIEISEIKNDTDGEGKNFTENAPINIIEPTAQIPIPIPEWEKKPINIEEEKVKEDIEKEKIQIYLPEALIIHSILQKKYNSIEDSSDSNDKPFIEFKESLRDLNENDSQIFSVEKIGDETLLNDKSDGSISKMQEIEIKLKDFTKIEKLLKIIEEFKLVNESLDFRFNDVDKALYSLENIF